MGRPGRSPSERGISSANRYPAPGSDRRSFGGQPFRPDPKPLLRPIEHCARAPRLWAGLGNPAPISRATSGLQFSAAMARTFLASAEICWHQRQSPRRTAGPPSGSARRWSRTPDAAGYFRGTCHRDTPRLSIAPEPFRPTQADRPTDWPISGVPRHAEDVRTGCPRLGLFSASCAAPPGQRRRLHEPERHS